MTINTYKVLKNLVGNQKPMLNKGLRDEEKIRIDNVLKTLLTMVFGPKPISLQEKTAIESQLKDFGLNIETLVDFPNEDLINLLLRLHFDWDHLEQFADFLMEFSKVEVYSFVNKALAIYQYIQQESKIFSFVISAKITSAKAKNN